MEDEQPLIKQPPLQPKKAGAFKKFLQWFVAIGLILLISFLWWKYYFTYSDGLQGGKMQKISKRGNVFKTWEGYLVISSAVDNNGLSLTSKEWPFTVVNDSIAHLLENYAEKKVKLRYHQKNGTLPWRGDSPYIIYEVILDQ